MSFREIQARSLLRRQKRVDSWFLSRSGMNLYRGCGHDCAYCDGRAEKYSVQGEFGVEVEVKLNAAELLRRELGPSGRRGPPPSGYVLLGGGVGDSYQPAEERYGLARRALEVLWELGRPVHVLTKSVLVERDLDLLARIHERSRAVVSMSFSSVDEEVSARFEPGVPPPAARLEVLSRVRRAGIPVGLYLMPVLPFLTDTGGILERTVEQVVEAGVGFIVLGGLTLKPGRQMEHFRAVLRGVRPDLEALYRRLYPGDQWGRAAGAYYGALERRFDALARKHRVPQRMTPPLYAGLLGAADLAVVTLEHLDHLVRLRGERSAFGAAARIVAARPQLATETQRDLFTGGREGLGPAEEAVLDELRSTGRCLRLELLLGG